MNDHKLECLFLGHVGPAAPIYRAYAKCCRCGCAIYLYYYDSNINPTIWKSGPFPDE